MGRTCHSVVTPTKVGVQLGAVCKVKLDFGLRRNDDGERLPSETMGVVASSPQQAEGQ